jgi:hypothetical protein
MVGIIELGLFFQICSNRLKINPTLVCRTPETQVFFSNQSKNCVKDQIFKFF